MTTLVIGTIGLVVSLYASNTKSTNEMKEIVQETIELRDYKIVEVMSVNGEVVTLISKGDYCARKWISPNGKGVTEDITYSAEYCEERQK